MRAVRTGALVAVTAVLLASCNTDDPVGVAADAICEAIDAEGSDVAAFEGYELAIAQERRDGIDEGELQAALNERCGRAIIAISAAGIEDEEVDEEEEEETELEAIDVRSIDWADQTWMTMCTGTAEDEVGALTPQPVTLTLDESDPDSARWQHLNPFTPDPGFPIYEVEIEDVAYGDVTGDGIDDAVFVSLCTHGNAMTETLEVWEGGIELVQLPEVLSYLRDGTIEQVEAVDGRLRVFSSEAAPGDDQPWLSEYPVEVVRDWIYEADEQTWHATEISRMDAISPPASEPEPEPEPEPQPTPTPTPAPEPEPVPEPAPEPAPAPSACDSLGFPGQDEAWCAEVLRGIEECIRIMANDPDYVEVHDGYENVHTGEWEPPCDI